MKISTQAPAPHSEAPEMNDSLRKSILAILFICLALTALADSVQLFHEVNQVRTLPLGIVYR